MQEFVHQQYHQSPHSPNLTLDLNPKPKPLRKASWNQILHGVLTKTSQEHTLEVLHDPKVVHVTGREVILQPGLAR